MSTTNASSFARSRGLSTSSLISSSSSSNRRKSFATSTATSKHHKHPHANSEASTSFEDPAWFASFTERSGSSIASSKRVYLSDQELYYRAKLASAKIDFGTLTDLSLNKWAWKANRKDFSLFTMDSEDDRQQPLEVLAAGDICCSIEEVINVLTPLNDPDFNATMQGVCKKEFIYGSIVHTIAPEALAVEGTFAPLVKGDYVAVKTGMFVRSNMFAHNEEWCFLESFDRCPSGNSFRLTQSTIDASEIGAGKASHARVDQLRGISTAFFVEKIPHTRSVRVFFYGKIEGSVNGSKGSKGVVPLKAAKARLMMIAKGVSHIPEIIRRRRLGIQKLANRSVFAVKNSRCTCCTKSLHFLTKKKRCYLCAYYVCDRCWSQQKMETFNGKITSILICTRCMECVDSCEYSDVIAKQSSCPVRVEPDDYPIHKEQAEPPGKALVDLLETALDDPDAVVKTAAMSVIKHILAQSKALDAKSSSKSSTTSSIRGSEYEEDPIKILEKCFERERQPRLEDCILANAEWRNYPIHMSEHPSSTVPPFPVPENEAQRLQVINESNFLNLGEVAELNIICALANQELACTISQITIVDQDSELILACNVKDLHRIRMARSQTFSSHLVMDDKPLLLRHPEADVRFCHLDAVAKSGIRFYCGFPITAKDGTVVGSLCCLEFEDRKLTQSQYSMMKKLAKTASRVIQKKGAAIAPRSEHPAAP